MCTHGVMNDINDGDVDDDDNGQQEDWPGGSSIGIILQRIGKHSSMELYRVLGRQKRCTQANALEPDRECCCDSADGFSATGVRIECQSARVPPLSHL